MNFHSYKVSCEYFVAVRQEITEDPGRGHSNLARSIKRRNKMAELFCQDVP